MSLANLRTFIQFRDPIVAAPRFPKWVDRSDIGLATRDVESLDVLYSIRCSTSSTCHGPRCSRPHLSVSTILESGDALR